jgi:hypothetical protein
VKDMSWSQALVWLSLIASAVMLTIGTRGSFRHRRRNRRTGLPTPTPESTRSWEDLPAILKRNNDQLASKIIHGLARNKYRLDSNERSN